MKLHLTNAILWFICALCFLIPVISAFVTGTVTWDLVFILRLITAVLSLTNASIHFIKYFKTN